MAVYTKTYIQAKIDKYNNAIEKAMDVESYELNTNQSAQKVKRQSIEVLEKALARWEKKMCDLLEELGEDSGDGIVYAHTRFRG